MNDINTPDIHRSGRVRQSPDRGLFLCDSGRRFWFNLRMLNSIGRKPMTELARLTGLRTQSLRMSTYSADVRAKDALSLNPVICASHFHGVPGDFLLHADQARVAEVAQLKRLEAKGLGVCPEIDPYHVIFMDCLGFEKQQEIMKMVYEMLGLSSKEIENIVIPPDNIGRILATAGIPKRGGLTEIPGDKEGEKDC